MLINTCLYFSHVQILQLSRVLSTCSSTKASLTLPLGGHHEINDLGLLTVLSSLLRCSLHRGWNYKVHLLEGLLWCLIWVFNISSIWKKTRITCEEKIRILSGQLAKIASWLEKPANFYLPTDWISSKSPGFAWIGDQKYVLHSLARVGASPGVVGLSWRCWTTTDNWHQKRRFMEYIEIP